MRSARHLARLSALVCTLSTLWLAAANLKAQTVGWCASTGTGDVYGVAYDYSLNVFYSSSYLSNLAWLDGGYNSSSDCFNTKAAEIKGMWSNWYGYGHTGAGDMCASAPGQIWYVDNTMSYVLWNPNGHQAYLNNDGNTVNLGTEYVRSFCCGDFHIC